MNTNESCLIIRQRKTIYFYSTAILCVGIPFNLMGWGGPVDPFFKILNAGHLLVIVLLWLLYCFRSLSVNKALLALVGITQAELSVEMIYCALHPTEYNTMLILGNTALSIIVLMLSLVAYIRILPYILGSIVMIIYLVCIELTGNVALKSFFPIFLFSVLALVLLGNRLVCNFHRLEGENRILKEEERELLETLHLNKSQVMAYVQLTRPECSDDKAAKLLEMIGEKQKRNLFNRVAVYITSQKTGMEQLAQAFPELSSSELEICRFILQGKKVKEICNLLDKTVGNITSQRTHIRTKLGLQPEENLKKILEWRMEQITS
ncbi:MAG: hypothetical protein LBS20_08250 [Prevotella sp.]|nr:hypothetical protein [Prevotella sp.]